MSHLCRYLVPVLLGLGIGAAGPVHACGLDGVPSISANGLLAQRNMVRPSRGSLGHWAQFVFSRTYGAGTAVRLTEDQNELRRTLPRQAFGQPWHWVFGDGTTGSGYTVQHAFSRPGRYKLIVSAYYSSYGAWLEFDEALITVAGAHG